MKRHVVKRLVVTGLLPALAVAALAVTAGRPAAAQEYPWCAEYGVRGGATNCGFATWGQCQAAISGVGGYCRENFFYRGPVARPRVGGPPYDYYDHRPRRVYKKRPRRPR